MKYTYACVLSNDTYLDGVLVLFNNLKSLDSKYPLICLVNDKVSKESKELLDFFGIKYKLYTSENIINKYLTDNIDYFNVFKLEEYEKIVYLDTSLLILKNIDDLFNEESLSMPKDYPFNKDKYNSRVMVLKPDSKIYTKLLKACEKSSEEFFSSTGVINEVFDKKINTLDDKYNSVREISESKYLNYNYLNNDQVINYGVEYFSNDFNKVDSINIVHYIGMMKPYNLNDLWADEQCYLYKNYLYKVHMKKYEYDHSKDLVSIIIPIYNKEKYLKRCLDSVINQTYHNYELILVDDVSTDKSNDICKEYLKYDNVHLITNKKNMGVSYTRNVGLDNSKGNYLMFVDADDYMEPNMLQRLYDTIRQYDVDFVQTNFYLNDEDVKDKTPGTRSYLDKKSIFKLFIDGYKINIAVWNKIYKRETIKDIRFNDESRNYEDNEFIFDLVTHSNKCVIIPDPLYHYFYMKEDCLTYKKMTDKDYKYFTSLLIRLYKYTHDYYPEYLDRARDLLETTPNYIGKRYKKLGIGEVKEYLQKEMKEIDEQDPNKYVEETKKEETDLLRKKLKEFRFIKSMSNKVMAADIFDDKALNKLIDKRPKTLDALGEMLDKNKIKEFGEELILVINS